MRRAGFVAGAALFLVGLIVAGPAFLDWIYLLTSDKRGFSDAVAPTFVRFGVGALLATIGQFLWRSAASYRPAINHYVFHGPVGVAGGTVDARKATINQALTVDLGQLAEELAELRTALARRAATPAEEAALGHVTMAEQSARDGDGSRAEGQLRAAGRVALDLARTIGVPVATAALKRSLGLP
jgi:hypothetical protein